MTYEPPYYVSCSSIMHQHKHSTQAPPAPDLLSHAKPNTHTSPSMSVLGSLQRKGTVDSGGSIDSTITNTTLLHHRPALAGLQDLHPRTSVPTSTLPIHYPWYTRGQHPGSSPRRYITHAPSAPPENGVVRGGKFCVRPVVAARKEYTVR